MNVRLLCCFPWCFEKGLGGEERSDQGVQGWSAIVTSLDQSCQDQGRPQEQGYLVILSPGTVLKITLAVLIIISGACFGPQITVN